MSGSLAATSRDEDRLNSSSVEPGGLGQSELGPVTFAPPESDPSRYRIKIVGVGGCGCNLVQTMSSRGVIGAEVILLGTDDQHLSHCFSGRKVRLGRSACRGIGTNRDINLGEKAAAEGTEDIQRALGNAETVFILCGLGGGTGSGAAPVVARIAAASGATVVALCTTPFSREGRIALKVANEGLKRLTKEADLVVVFANERLLTSARATSLNSVFRIPTEVFIRVVRGVTEGYATTDDKTISF